MSNSLVENQSTIMIDPESAFKTILRKMLPASKRQQFFQSVDAADASALKFLLSIGNWKMQSAPQKKSEGLKVLSLMQSL